MFRLLYICIIVSAAASMVFFRSPEKNQQVLSSHTKRVIPSMSPSPTITTPPAAKILKNDYYISQSFNNCGPAALSMALSYLGINKTQEELGQDLRPYQTLYGDNDDKSVTLQELAKKAEEYNLVAFHRPNGNIALLKQFLTYDMPVVTRTWLNEDEDIGHYRIIKGYDDTTEKLIQDDSFQGANLEYSYKTFGLLWQKFNYEYLVLVPKDKQHVAEAILGDNKDAAIAWEKAIKNAQKELEKNPEDIYMRFNLSVAFYNSGDYENAVREFEKVEHMLPSRTLWYQIEPIQAYFAVGKYEKVFSITETILNNQNRAFSELYFLRGKIYEKQGHTGLAQQEFNQATFYNKNVFTSFRL